MAVAKILPNDPIEGHRLKLAEILRAGEVIDPVFLNSPQYDCEPLSKVLGCRLTIKLDFTNPIRSFKGRGANAIDAELPVQRLMSPVTLRRTPPEKSDV